MVLSKEFIIRLADYVQDKIHYYHLPGHYFNSDEVEEIIYQFMESDNMPVINIEYTNTDIIKLILKDLEQKMPGFNFNEKHLDFMVMSKQNYRVQDWEKGQLKVTVDSSKIFAGDV